ncbi:MAG: amino acid permease [SAR202 cluster bacterium]|nr:amino acid permease [SAR202 cluster bacterium]
MKRALGFFDVTNITVGSIIGADIYIASALTAGLIGPFALFVWVVAGLMAAVLALVFAFSSHYVPGVGGPFAYVSEAYNDFWGFLAGWSLWIAELIALPVFAIAFSSYLQYFVELSAWQDMLVKAAFLLTLTTINVVGVRAAGTVNDILTILKLSPLLLLVIAGLVYIALHGHVLGDNLTPLTPLGLGHFGESLVLIFWAYVGFELTGIPAGEVRDPARTIPRAIVTGIIIVTLFYLTTHFVVYGVLNWQELAQTSTPLVSTGAIVLGSVGAAVIGIGALISVSGSDESDMLATGRLSYSMAAYGLFPKPFAKLHPKFGTPSNALIAQGALAFLISIFSGIPKLISFSVFNLGFVFLLTCLALLVLQKRAGHSSRRYMLIPLLGLGICCYLLYSTSVTDKLVGSGVLMAGVFLYAFFSPKVELSHSSAPLISTSERLAHSLSRERRFLGNLFHMLRRLLGSAAKP